jgi:hypothetical protein
MAVSRWHLPMKRPDGAGSPRDRLGRALPTVAVWFDGDSSNEDEELFNVG